MQSERVIPLLSPIQRKSFEIFKDSVKQLWERWGEYLWIHLDEKWLHGMLICKIDKQV